MRSLLVVVLLVITAALVAVMVWPDAAMPGPGPLPGDTGPIEAHAPASDRGAASEPSLPPGVVATRSAAAPVVDLAATPTAWLRIVDLASERPLLGAAVRAVDDGSDLSFSDDRGLAPVAIEAAAQLAVVLDGYLLRMVPTRPGSSVEQPQEVRLVPDRWSIARSLRFVARGREVGEVFVRLRPSGGVEDVDGPPAADAILHRAWVEHSMLATRSASRDVPVQRGHYDEHRVYRLPNEARVRFLAAGDYRVEAATTDGLVGRATLRVVPGPEPAPTRIELQPGAVLGGVVRSGDGQPLGAAKITLLGGDPLGLEATSDEAGRFVIGPLWPEPVALLCRHGDHQPLSHGPAQVPGEVDVRLQPLPRTTLRGRVRAVPDQRPLAGARVVWNPAGGAPVSAITDAQGAFTLPATGEVSAPLHVSASGFVTRSELVEPGAAFADYDLLPADPEARLGAGMTAILRGAVFDANGQPVQGMAVRWQPSTMPSRPIELVGRRVLAGGSLDLALATSTREDGTFALETNCFGDGQLVVGDAGVATTAIAGRETKDIRLRR